MVILIVKNTGCDKTIYLTHFDFKSMLENEPRNIVKYIANYLTKKPVIHTQMVQLCLLSRSKFTKKRFEKNVYAKDSNTT